MIVGTRTVEKLLVELHGVIGTDDFQRRVVACGHQRAATTHRVSRYAEPVGVDAGAHRAVAGVGEVAQGGHQLRRTTRRLIERRVRVDRHDDEAVRRQAPPDPRDRRLGRREAGADRHGRVRAGGRRVVHRTAAEATHGARHRRRGDSERTGRGVEDGGCRVWALSGTDWFAPARPQPAAAGRGRRRSGAASDRWSS